MLNKQAQGKNSRKKGIFAEIFACFLLRIKGYEIIERNYRPHKGIGLGEIDIIAKIGNTLCFVEVKYRKSKESSSYAITYDTKKRIEKTAIMYVAFNSKYSKFDIRFDALLMNPFSFPMHIINAWRIDE